MQERAALRGGKGYRGKRLKRIGDKLTFYSRGQGFIRAYGPY